MYVALNLDEAARYYEDYPSCTVKCIRDGTGGKIVGTYEDALDYFNEPETEIQSKKNRFKDEQSAFIFKAVNLIRRLSDTLEYGLDYTDSEREEVKDFLGIESIPKNTNYAALKKILKRAFNQAADGKGKERHAAGKAFEEQPIIRIQELVGSGFCLGQAIKKIQESIRLETPQASMELLGAINYIAAVIFFRERQYTKED